MDRDSNQLLGRDEKCEQRRQKIQGGKFTRGVSKLYIQLTGRVYKWEQMLGPKEIKPLIGITENLLKDDGNSNIYISRCKLYVLFQFWLPFYYN